MQIDEDYSIKKRVSLTPVGNQQKMCLPDVFYENGLPRLAEVELVMDKVNKVIGFKYDEPLHTMKAQKMKGTA